MLTDLIERLEKEGGSRELDALVFEQVGKPMPEKFASLDLPSDSWQPANKYGGYFLEGVGIDHPLFDVHYQCPSYTQSLDAAIALCERVLPDPFWGLHTNRVANVYHADVGTRQPHRTWLGSADNPATALCIALLRALEDKDHA